MTTLGPSQREGLNKVFEALSNLLADPLRVPDLPNWVEETFAQRGRLPAWANMTTISREGIEALLGNLDEAQRRALQDGADMYVLHVRDMVEERLQAIAQGEKGERQAREEREALAQSENQSWDATSHPTAAMTELASSGDDTQVLMPVDGGAEKFFGRLVGNAMEASASGVRYPGEEELLEAPQVSLPQLNGLGECFQRIDQEMGVLIYELMPYDEENNRFKEFDSVTEAERADMQFTEAIGRYASMLQQAARQQRVPGKHLDGGFLLMISRISDMYPNIAGEQNETLLAEQTLWMMIESVMMRDLRAVTDYRQAASIRAMIANCSDIKSLLAVAVWLHQGNIDAEGITFYKRRTVATDSQRGLVDALLASYGVAFPFEHFDPRSLDFIEAIRLAQYVRGTPPPRIGDVLEHLRVNGCIYDGARSNMEVAMSSQVRTAHLLKHTAQRHMVTRALKSHKNGVATEGLSPELRSCRSLLEALREYRSGDGVDSFDVLEVDDRERQALARLAVSLKEIVPYIFSRHSPDLGALYNGESGEFITAYEQRIEYAITHGDFGVIDEFSATCRMVQACIIRNGTNGIVNARSIQTILGIWDGPEREKTFRKAMAAEVLPKMFREIMPRFLQDDETDLHHLNKAQDCMIRGDVQGFLELRAEVLHIRSIDTGLKQFTSEEGFCTNIRQLIIIIITHFESPHVRLGILAFFKDFNPEDVGGAKDTKDLRRLLITELRYRRTVHGPDRLEPYEGNLQTVPFTDLHNVVTEMCQASFPPGLPEPPPESVAEISPLEALRAQDRDDANEKLSQKMQDWATEQSMGATFSPGKSLFLQLEIREAYGQKLNVTLISERPRNAMEFELIEERARWKSGSASGGDGAGGAMIHTERLFFRDCYELPDGDSEVPQKEIQGVGIENTLDTLQEKVSARHQILKESMPTIDSLGKVIFGPVGEILTTEPPPPFGRTEGLGRISDPRLTGDRSFLLKKILLPRFVRPFQGMFPKNVLMKCLLELPLIQPIRQWMSHGLLGERLGKFPDPIPVKTLSPYLTLQEKASLAVTHILRRNASGALEQGISSGGLQRLGEFDSGLRRIYTQSTNTDLAALDDLIGEEGLEDAFQEPLPKDLVLALHEEYESKPRIQERDIRRVVAVMSEVREILYVPRCADLLASVEVARLDTTRNSSSRPAETS